MISTTSNQRQRDAGEIDCFTLIELLIVIVVLGILAAVVIFALGGITGKSAVSACQADGATISTAMAAFAAQNRRHHGDLRKTGFWNITAAGRTSSHGLATCLTMHSRLSSCSRYADTCNEGESTGGFNSACRKRIWRRRVCSFTPVQRLQFATAC